MKKCRHTWLLCLKEDKDAVGSQWAAGDIMYKDLNGDGKISEEHVPWEIMAI